MSAPTLIVLVAGTKAKASDMNGNFQAFAATYGHLQGTDLDPAANIKGSQLSASPGTNLTNANYGDNSVDSRVLQKDATAGSPLAAINQASLIKDGLITTGKIAGNTILVGNLKILANTVTLTAGPLAANATAYYDLQVVGSAPFTIGQVRPLLISIDRPDPPAGTNLAAQLWRDTTSNKFWLAITNLNPSILFTIPANWFCTVYALSTV